MKALVLGSSGYFGSATARRLAGNPNFEQLILASRDQSKVQGLANELGDAAQTLTLDIFDHQSLKAAAEGVDVVVNVSGATLDTAVPAMRAVAEASTPYCDIAAESGVLLQAEGVEKELDSSGTTLLVGAGFHPGVTDLLGEYAISILDEVHRLEIFIVGNLRDYDDPESAVANFDSGNQGSEALKTLFVSLGLPAYVIKDGTRALVSPREMDLPIATPDGFQIDFTGFSTLEPLAANRRHPDVKNVAILYGAWPNRVNSVLRQVSPKVVSNEMTTASAGRAMYSAALPLEDADPNVQYWVDARGKKDGKDTCCRVYSSKTWATNAHMTATTTGVVCLAAEKLASGEISPSGLVTAAEILTPKEVFSFLAEGEDPEIVVELSHC